jgi:hypothetical protein
MISRLFLELKLEIIKVAVFRAFLNTVIVFLALALLANFFSVKIIYALVLALIFFAINTYLNYASVTLKSIEEQNPEVREMLRTAKDNMQGDNIMVKALHQELLQKAKHISSGNLFSYRNLVVKFVIIAALAFGMIFTATMNVNFKSINPSFDALRFKNTKTTDSPPVDLTDVTLEDASDLYGEERVAKLGNEILNLNINPSLSEIDLNKVSEEEGTSLSRVSYPVDVGQAQGAGAGGARKTEDSELVNAFYLKKIKK